MKLIYGLHNPKYVSDAKVISYAERLEWHGEIYRLRDFSEESRSKYQYLANNFPDLLVYNSNGLLTKFETDCSSDLDSIANLAPESIDQMELKGKSLQEFISDTYVINGLQNEDLTLLKMPLYVVKFAEFAGKLNKDNVPALVQQLRHRKDIHYIVLNLDYTVVE